MFVASMFLIFAHSNFLALRLTLRGGQWICLTSRSMCQIQSFWHLFDDSIHIRQTKIPPAHKRRFLYGLQMIHQAPLQFLKHVSIHWCLHLLLLTPSHSSLSLCNQLIDYCLVSRIPVWLRLSITINLLPVVHQWPIPCCCSLKDHGDWHSTAVSIHLRKLTGLQDACFGEQQSERNIEMPLNDPMCCNEEVNEILGFSQLYFHKPNFCWMQTILTLSLQDVCPSPLPELELCGWSLPLWRPMIFCLRDSLFSYSPDGW